MKKNFSTKTNLSIDPLMEMGVTEDHNVPIEEKKMDPMTKDYHEIKRKISLKNSFSFLKFIL